MCWEGMWRGTEIRIMLWHAKEKYPSHAERMDSILWQLPQEEPWEAGEFVEDVNPAQQPERVDMIDRLVSMINAWFTNEERAMFLERLVEPIGLEEEQAWEILEGIPEESIQQIV